MTTPVRLASVLMLAALAAPALHGAQPQDTRRTRDRVARRAATFQQTADPCANRRDNDDEGESFCQMKEERLGAMPLNVDAGRNGGIRVAGWDRNETVVQAVIQTHARTAERARQIADGIHVQTSGGQIRAVGPERDRGAREWWSVSFRINAPRQTDLTLQASNGGLTVGDVSGNIQLETTNGGIHLTDVGGWVRGRTRNGGLSVALSGQSWDGTGLDVETTNGGVSLAIPDGYSADLETRTTNGGFRSEIPLTLQGDLTPRHGISTRLGAGGPPLRVRTTNGGVRLTKR